MCEKIFERKVENAKNNNETNIHCSYLEIYNEQLRDLLEPNPKQLKIFANKDNTVVVKNLDKIYCEDYLAMQKCQDNGKKLRVVGATQMNKTSSRSHAVFTIYF
jgi:hypothetical protein